MQSYQHYFCRDSSDTYDLVFFCFLVRGGYLATLKKFAKFITAYEPTAINNSVTEIIHKFNLPLPVNSIDDFLEEICYYNVTGSEGETSTGVRSNSTPSGKYLLSKSLYSNRGIPHSTFCV